jgi:hypothetical protein|tara:strand:- start:19 stop:570 length:552 start_codon:yes stop_codon:yes gene_type:complete
MAVTTIPTAGIADNAVTAAKASGLGKIIAIYQDGSATQYAKTGDDSESFTDVTDVAITLTPASSSSKFWLTWNTFGNNIAGASQALNVDLDFKRAISSGTTTAKLIQSTIAVSAGRRFQYDNRSSTLGINYLNCTMTVSFLDSPSTASQIVYTPQFSKNQWAGTSGTSMGVYGGMFQIMEFSG